MSVSETTLAIQQLEVQSNSAYDTPVSGTPIPTKRLSSDTLNLLEDAARRLKSEPGPSNRGKGKKRKLNEADHTSSAPIDNPQEGFPARAKPVYLKLKSMYIKKMNYASNIHHINSELQAGRFPAQVNFRCACPVSDNATFSQDWTTMTSRMKRELTNKWMEELSRKYQAIKANIAATYAELELILSPIQLTELRSSLNEKFKRAAPKKLARKTNTRTFPPKGPRPQRANKPRPNNRQGGADNQINSLLKGLMKALKNSK